MFRRTTPGSSFSQYPYSATSPSGWTHQPLYPVGPTIPKKQFAPVQSRSMMPSPYLGREGMRPPSYEERYLKRAENLTNQVNISYEEKQRRLIEQNEHQIKEQNKRRDQLRVSYERQIQTVRKKLERNMQSKQKLLNEIQNLQTTHDEMHEKLMSIHPPEAQINDFEPIDRKQQEMILLKGQLVNSMKEKEIDFNEKVQEEYRYWEQQLEEKQKYLFTLEQNLRDKRLELWAEKEKSFEKPDLFGIQEQIRSQKYEDFIYKHQQLQKKVDRIIEQRQKSIRNLLQTVEIKKPQIHNQNMRIRQLQVQISSIKLKNEQMARVCKEMQGANGNLTRELERKQQMISHYELDIHNLRQKKVNYENQVKLTIDKSRKSFEQFSLTVGFENDISKLEEELRFQQNRNQQLKGQYQTLYELLCSATTKTIHRTFNDFLVKEYQSSF